MDKYSFNYTIIGHDMDNYYRFMPTAILTYFEDCFARYMSCLNLAAFDLVKDDKLWIITEFTAERTDVQAFWSEEIKVEMWISEITPLRIYSDFYISRADDGKLLSKGTSCWSIINAKTRKLERTDFLKDKITIVPEIVIDHKKLRFKEQGEDIIRVEHKVNLLDLDFNGHVNNKSYLSIALLTTTEEFMSAHRVKFFSIHWLLETYLGDNINCDLKKTDENNDFFLHTLKNSSDKKVAEIYSEWISLENIDDISDAIERK